MSDCSTASRSLRWWPSPLRDGPRRSRADLQRRLDWRDRAAAALAGWCVFVAAGNPGAVELGLTLDRVCSRIAGVVARLLMRFAEGLAVVQPLAAARGVGMVVSLVASIGAGI